MFEGNSHSLHCAVTCDVACDIAEHAHVTGVSAGQTAFFALAVTW